jgi:outer membrane protein TolC
MNFDPGKWSVPVVPTDSVRSEGVSIDVEAGTRAALDRRPEILAQAYQADSNRIRWDYWRNQTLPRLDLIGSYGRAGVAGRLFNPDTGEVVSRTNFGESFSQIFNENFPNWSVGLQFSYPILNRSARGAREAARYTYESSRATLSTVEQNVLVEVRAAARAIDTAARSIVAAQKGRELAERNLDAEKKKFDNGMTTSFQVNQIQRDLSAARTAELQALAVYRKALAGYHFAVADILDWKGIRVEGIPETKPPETRIAPGSH